MAKLVVVTKTGAKITYSGSESEIRKLAQLHSALKSQIVEFAPDVQVNKYVTATSSTSYTGKEAEKKALEEPQKETPQRVEILASQVTAKDVEAMYERGYVYAGQTGPMTHAWEKITPETQPTTVNVPATTTVPAVHYVTPTGERKEVLAPSVEESAKIAQELMKSGEAVATTLIDKEVVLKSEKGEPLTIPITTKVKETESGYVATLTAPAVSGFVDVSKIETKKQDIETEKQKTAQELMKELENKWIEELPFTQEEKKKLETSLEEVKEKALEKEIEETKAKIAEIRSYEEKYKKMEGAEKSITDISMLLINPIGTLSAGLKARKEAYEETAEMLKKKPLTEEDISEFEKKYMEVFEREKEKELSKLFAYEVLYAKEKSGKEFEYIIERAPGSLPGIITTSYSLGAGIGAISKISPLGAKATSLAVTGVSLGATASYVAEKGFTEELQASLLLSPIAFLSAKAGFESVVKPEYKVTFDFGKAKVVEKAEKGLIDIGEGEMKAKVTNIKEAPLKYEYTTKTQPKITTEEPTDILRVVKGDVVTRTPVETIVEQRAYIQKGKTAPIETIKSEKTILPGGKELAGKYTTYTKASRGVVLDLYYTPEKTTEPSFLKPIESSGEGRNVIQELQKAYELARLQTSFKAFEDILQGKYLHLMPKVTTEKISPQTIAPIVTISPEIKSEKIEASITPKVTTKIIEEYETFPSQAFSIEKTTATEHASKMIEGIFKEKPISSLETKSPELVATKTKSELQTTTQAKDFLEGEKIIGTGKDVERFVEDFGEKIKTIGFDTTIPAQFERIKERQEEKTAQKEKTLEKQLEKPIERSIEKATTSIKKITEMPKITTTKIVLPPLKIPKLLPKERREKLPSLPKLLFERKIKSKQKERKIIVSPIMGSVSMFLYGKASPPKITEEVKRRAHLYVPSREIQMKKKPKTRFGDLFKMR